VTLVGLGEDVFYNAAVECSGGAEGSRHKHRYVLIIGTQRNVPVEETRRTEPRLLQIKRHRTEVKVLLVHWGAAHSTQRSIIDKAGRGLRLTALPVIASTYFAAWSAAVRAIQKVGPESGSWQDLFGSCSARCS
jgi:hypothetical protein